MAAVIPPPEVLLLTFGAADDPAAEKYELKSAPKLEFDPLFEALVNRLLSMSAAFGAAFTFKCRSRLDCVEEVELVELRLELSRFLELPVVGEDFSSDVSDPPDMAPYIGPKIELRFDEPLMYCDSMLELAAA